MTAIVGKLPATGILMTGHCFQKIWERDYTRSPHVILNLHSIFIFS